jgi:hypothetical protein
MNVNGLWTLNVMVNGRATTLVATIDNGKLTGGNTWYYYIGEVKLEGDTITGTVTGQHYFDQPDPLLGGMKTIPLQIKAKVGDGVMQGTAKIQGLPMELGFTAKKRA